MPGVPGFPPGASWAGDETDSQFKGFAHVRKRIPAAATPCRATPRTIKTCASGFLAAEAVRNQRAGPARSGCRPRRVQCSRNALASCRALLLPASAGCRWPALQAVSQRAAPARSGRRPRRVAVLRNVSASCLALLCRPPPAVAGPPSRRSANALLRHAAAAGRAACPRTKAQSDRRRGEPLSRRRSAAATAARKAAARSPDEPWLRPRLRKPAGAMDGPAGANHSIPPCVRQGVMCDGWSRNQIRSHSSVIARRSSDV